MTAPVVFLGPTLPVNEARLHLDAHYLPPAAHGDVFRTAQRRPAAIALIDGRFDAVPSVWHKEILWALSEGVAVYGASSMGALRAAELARFGMQGVGAVFDEVAAGVLVDDDEVAIAHAGGDDGWRPLSDALVDVRSTLARAVADGVLDPAAAAALVARVKATFYAHRSLHHCLDNADPAHRALRAWLPSGWVHRKRDDAILLLRRVAADLADGTPPPRRSWTFQRTTHWDAAQRALEAADDPTVTAGATTDEVEVDLLLEEIHLDPDRYQSLVDAAAAGLLIRRQAQRFGAVVPPDPNADQSGVDDARRAGDGLGGADTAWWSERRRLRRWFLVSFRSAMRAELTRTARTAPAYSEVRLRAHRKQAVLATAPSPEPAPAPAPDDLIAWYFTTVLGREVPDPLRAWCDAHGWDSPTALVDALDREWRFQRSGGAESGRSEDR